MKNHMDLEEINRYSTYKKYYNLRVYTHVHTLTDGLNSGLE